MAYVSLVSISFERKIPLYIRIIERRHCIFGKHPFRVYIFGETMKSVGEYCQICGKNFPLKGRGDSEAVLQEMGLTAE